MKEGMVMGLRGFAKKMALNDVTGMNALNGKLAKRIPTIPLSKLGLPILAL